MGVGEFDHLEWTYNGAFEQLFGLGSGGGGENLNKIFQKFKCRGKGCPGGCLSFDLTGTLLLKRKSGEEEMLFFPRYRISVDSAVVPFNFSTKARPVKLEQKICFNLQK